VGLDVAQHAQRLLAVGRVEVAAQEPETLHAVVVGELTQLGVDLAQPRVPVVCGFVEHRRSA